MELQRTMYNNNIFILDSKSESNGKVSVNLGFFVLCLFVRLLLPPQGFAPKAKSQGGTLVTGAYITVKPAQAFPSLTD